MSAEVTASTIAAGRKAAFVLNAVSDKIVEMTTTIMENAIRAHRDGELTPERSLVGWGKIDALWGLREWLEDEVKLGEAATAAERTGQPR